MAGAMDMWDDSAQNHMLIYGGASSTTSSSSGPSSSRLRLLAVGNAARLHALVRCAVERLNEGVAESEEGGGQRRLHIVFGSTVGDGLARPASSAPLGASSSASTPLASAVVPVTNSVAFLDDAASVAHHVGMHLSHSLAIPSSLAVSALGRSLVAVPSALLPLLVPAHDTAARRRIHALLCLPPGEAILGQSEAVLAGAVDGSSSQPMKRFPFASLLEAIEARRSLVKATAVDLFALPDMAGAPPAILRLVNSGADADAAVSAPSKKAKKGAAANTIDLAALPLAKAIPRSETHIVAAPFDYYHYRCDGFTDDGWGCAYRAAQTIVSWLQRRGMTEPKAAAMPSLRDIQRVLVEVDPAKAKGDGEKMGSGGFVGSSEWIGSYEVMLVLQRYCPSLDCGLVRVETGAAFGSDAALMRQLSSHFAKGGCPVMVGGSQYAHVIAGINANVRSGAAQLLIVDPHYSSAAPEAARAAQRGFVAWKDAATFFDAKSWYNVCIPRVYDVDLS